MSAFRVFAGLLVAVGCVLYVAPSGRAQVAPAAPPAPARSDREAKLEKNNALLAQMLADAHDETARLKEKVRELERKLAQRQVRVVPTPVPAPGLQTPSIPKGWVPRQFNGETYYLIPLKGSN